MQFGVIGILYAIIGIIIGFCLYRLFVVPIVRARSRKKCKRDGLVPWYFK